MTTPLTNEIESPEAVAAQIAALYRADLSRWVQDWYAYDAEGAECEAGDSMAVCWCLRGAIEKLVPGETVKSADLQNKVFNAFDRALGFESRHGEDTNRIHFIEWNDARNRTVGEVIDLCDRVAGPGAGFAAFRAASLSALRETP